MEVCLLETEGNGAGMQCSGVKVLLPWSSVREALAPGALDALANNAEP